MPGGKIIVIGLGNTIKGDDAVGIHVVRLLGTRMAGRAGKGDIAIKEIEDAPINIIEAIEGYDKVVIVDAIEGPPDRVGDIHCLTHEALRKSNITYSTHQVGLPRIMQLAEDLHLRMPKETVIYAIGINEVDGFASALSDEIKGVVPEVVRLVEAEIMKTPC